MDPRSSRLLGNGVENPKMLVVRRYLRLLSAANYGDMTCRPRPRGSDCQIPDPRVFVLLCMRVPNLLLGIP